MSFVTLALVVVLAGAPGDDEDLGKCPLSGQPAKAEHRIVSEGKTVAFCCPNCLKKYIASRENRLTEAQERSHWTLLFDGRTLNGFRKPTRDSQWEVRDGVLVGSGGPGVLATEGEYESFLLTADVKVHDTGERRGNSGFFIRSTALDAQNGRWPDGFEIQVDHGDPSYWTGSIWKTARAEKVATRDGEWFTLRLEAAGPRIRVWVNGKLTTEHVDAKAVRPSPISIQVHHPTDVVEIKNLKIQEFRQI